MSKMLPFVTSCNRNVTIFFPKKWIFLGARCVENLKMGTKKKCHSSDVTKKKNKLFYIEMKNPKISHFWERGSRAHGTFSKKMVTLSLWRFVTTIFMRLIMLRFFHFFPVFFGYIWLHLVTFGYIFKK